MSTNTFPIFFDSVSLTASDSPIYSVPTSPTTIILQELRLKVTNYTGATRTVTLYAIPASSSASNETAIIVSHSVPPYDYIELPVPRLDAGGSITGFSDQANALTVQALGGKLHTP